jgi:menaquinone-dependent protoporphyrinogen IX oxidase
MRPGAWDELSIMRTRYPDIQPVAVALFGGALRKADLSLIERLLVRRLPDGDFRDWEAIASWADVVADTLASQTNGTRRTT